MLPFLSNATDELMSQTLWSDLNRSAEGERTCTILNLFKKETNYAKEKNKELTQTKKKYKTYLAHIEEEKKKEKECCCG